MESIHILNSSVFRFKFQLIKIKVISSVALGTIQALKSHTQQQLYWTTQMKNKQLPGFKDNQTTQCAPTKGPCGYLMEVFSASKVLSTPTGRVTAQLTTDFTGHSKFTANSKYLLSEQTALYESKIFCFFFLKISSFYLNSQLIYRVIRVLEG